MARGPLGPRGFPLCCRLFSLIFSLERWWRGWAGPHTFFVFICCKVLARWYNLISTTERIEMKYEVTIQARVVKTYTVEADNEDVAYELAHELFSVLNDDIPERYEEETLDIREVK